MTIEEVREGMIPQLDYYARECLRADDEDTRREIRKDYKQSVHVYNSLLKNLFGNDPSYTDRKEFPRKITKYIDERIRMAWMVKG